MLLSQIEPRALRVLHNRPYWSRLWIVQELCVAKEIQLANRFAARAPTAYLMPNMRSAEFSRLQPALDVETEVTADLHRLMRHYRHYGNTDRGLNIGTLLDCTANANCTDPHDRVFSLLCPAYRYWSQRIEPDYTASPWDTFCRVIRVILDISPRLLSRGPFYEDVRRSLDSCRHRPHILYVSERETCDGFVCNAWACCLEIARQPTPIVPDLELGMIEKATSYLFF